MRTIALFLVLIMVSATIPNSASGSTIQRLTQRIQNLRAKKKASTDPVLRAKLTSRIQRLRAKRKKLKSKISKNTSADPAGTTTSIGNILGNITGSVARPASKSNFSRFSPRTSGDFGLTNLRLNSSARFTSFDDSTLGTSGHAEEYNLSLSGDLTEDDTLYFTLSNSRFKTAGDDGILATSNGFSSSWIHSLNDTFGIGAFGLLNSVDIEDFNGNSYSYAYGLLFTSYHSFEYFDFSTASAIAHTDFESGYDQLFMTSATVSKSWNDEFSSYLTISFTDSFKSDPEADPTFGSWTVGADYLVSNNLTVGVAFQRTEFLNNFSDNSLMVSASWVF